MAIFKIVRSASLNRDGMISHFVIKLPKRAVEKTVRRGPCGNGASSRGRCEGAPTSVRSFSFGAIGCQTSGYRIESSRDFGISQIVILCYNPENEEIFLHLDSISYELRANSPGSRTARRKQSQVLPVSPGKLRTALLFYHRLGSTPRKRQALL